LKCRASASIIRASASFSVWPVAWTFQATATATHSPSSLRCTSTSNCIPSPRLVALGKGGMAGSLVGDRVVVVGGHGAAHAYGADDAAVLDERHGAPAEDELIVAERGDVVGEELALGEPLFQIERGRVKRGGGVGLRARDLGRHPERAVHAIAAAQVPGVVDDGDRHLEAERLRLGKAALDALARPGPRQRHRHGTSIQTSPPSIVTG